jgi:transcriptional regulator with XRE-family HTH domain
MAHRQEAGMARTGGNKDVGLVILLLRSLRDWSQARLSKESGVEASMISDYERGKTRASRPTLERIAAAVGVPLSFVEQLVPVCRRIRLEYEQALGLSPGDEPVDVAPGLSEKVAAAVEEAMAPFLLQLSHLEDAPARAEDRAWAAQRWATLEPLEPEDQSSIVDLLAGDDRSWALAQRICKASVAAAAHRADEALRLARLAVRLAERVPGPAAWRLSVLASCEPFVANALRVGGDLAAAARSSARAEDLSRQGRGGDPAGLLEPSPW